jgi:thiol-disulfide isomerase/thioredoxin
MVSDWFSVLLRKIFILVCLMAVSLSVFPADSDFFSPEKNLQAVVPVAAPLVNLPSLKTNDNEPYEYMNGVRLIHFWASWCVPCREEFPALQRLHEDFNSKGLTILAIAADNKNAVSNYVLQHDINLPVVIDQYGKAMFDYKVKALPSTYLVDKEGMIRFRANGHVRWDRAETRQLLEKIINE